MAIEDMGRLIEVLEGMNSNLERIAKALEREDPVIIPYQKGMTGDIRSKLERLVPTKEFYDPIKSRWSSRYRCPRCGHITIAYRDDEKAWYKCEECGKEDEIRLKDFGL